MKNKIYLFTTFLVLTCLSFFSCKTNVNTKNEKKLNIQMNILMADNTFKYNGNESVGRKSYVEDDIILNSYEYTLLAKRGDEEPITLFESISYSEVVSKTVNIETGIWTFTLIGSIESQKYLIGTVENVVVSIDSEDTIKLSFELQYNQDAEGTYNFTISKEDIIRVEYDDEMKQYVDVIPIITPFKITVYKIGNDITEQELVFDEVIEGEVPESPYLNMLENDSDTIRELEFELKLPVGRYTIFFEFDKDNEFINNKTYSDTINIYGGITYSKETPYKLWNNDKGLEHSILLYIGKGYTKQQLSEAMKNCIVSEDGSDTNFTIKLDAYHGDYGECSTNYSYNSKTGYLSCNSYDFQCALPIITFEDKFISGWYKDKEYNEQAVWLCDYDCNSTENESMGNAISCRYLCCEENTGTEILYAKYLHNYNIHIVNGNGVIKSPSIPNVDSDGNLLIENCNYDCPLDFSIFYDADSDDKQDDDNFFLGFYYDNTFTNRINYFVSNKNDELDIYIYPKFLDRNLSIVYRDYDTKEILDLSVYEIPEGLPEGIEFSNSGNDRIVINENSFECLKSVRNGYVLTKLYLVTDDEESDFSYYDGEYYKYPNNDYINADGTIDVYLKYEKITDQGIDINFDLHEENNLTVSYKQTEDNQLIFTADKIDSNISREYKKYVWNVTSGNHSEMYEDTEVNTLCLNLYNEDGEPVYSTSNLLVSCMAYYSNNGKDTVDDAYVNVHIDVSAIITIDDLIQEPYNLYEGIDFVDVSPSEFKNIWFDIEYHKVDSANYRTIYGISYDEIEKGVIIDGLSHTNWEFIYYCSAGDPETDSYMIYKGSASAELKYGVNNVQINKEEESSEYGYFRFVYDCNALLVDESNKVTIDFYKVSINDDGTRNEDLLENDGLQEFFSTSEDEEIEVFDNDIADSFTSYSQCHYSRDFEPGLYKILITHNIQEETKTFEKYFYIRSMMTTKYECLCIYGSNVVYELDGGSWNEADRDITESEYFELIPYDIFKIIPIPQKENYTFAGWNYKVNGNPLSMIDGKYILENNPSVIEDGSITITAMWTQE